jgi:hypothetical protein
MDKEILLTIPRPGKECGNCGAEIESLERHPSVIRLVRSQMAERLDYCPACWEHLKREAWDSFWITRRPPKEQKVPHLTRRERAVALRALFESLWERRAEGDYGPHLYLLAHLLMKWGGLKWRENRSETGGAELVVFEDPASGDRLELAAMEIDDARLAAIKAEIEDFLRRYSPEEEVAL